MPSPSSKAAADGLCLLLLAIDDFDGILLNENCELWMGSESKPSNSSSSNIDGNGIVSYNASK